MESLYRHEPDRTWPSSLSEDGRVGWRMVRAEADGSLEVTHPDVRSYKQIIFNTAVLTIIDFRWEKMRATEGWAALQHHSILHSTLTVYPPKVSKGGTIPRLVCQLTQGSYFATMPKHTRDRNRKAFTPEWHAGNVYATRNSVPIAIDMSEFILRDEPTEFDVFISGDYEVCFPNLINYV